MDDWREAPLEGFLTRITYGFTNPMPTTEFGPYMVTARDINYGRILYEKARSTSEEAFLNDITDKSRPDIGDVLVTKDGTLGRIAIVDKDNVCINQSVALLKPATNIRSRFLKFLLEEPRNFSRMIADADGTTIKHIYVTRLAKMLVRVPSIEAQDEIIEVLGSLDDKIELNRRTNETLEALARAIFKDWFVDFGPTRAKAEGRQPYLSSELWDLFPNALDDDDKPVRWEVSKIGEEVKAVGGATPSTKQPAFWEAGEHNWATPKDLSKLPSLVLLRTDRKITDAGIAKISSGLLPAGTILLSSRAPIGYLAIVEAPTAVNQGFVAMVCDKRLTNLFVFFWCEQNLDYIKGIAGGSTFAEISKKVFRPIPVVVPENKCIIAFDEIVRPLYNKIVSNTKENETLAQTRDLLLPKLMSGEIRLREAEKIVEAVA